MNHISQIDTHSPGLGIKRVFDSPVNLSFSKDFLPVHFEVISCSVGFEDKPLVTQSYCRLIVGSKISFAEMLWLNMVLDLPLIDMCGFKGENVKWLWYHLYLDIKEDLAAKGDGTCL